MESKQSNPLNQLRALWAQLPWWAWLLAGSAALIHLGTAILRLDTFWPFPQTVDFSAFYAGAWAWRLGASPYAWTPDLLAFLQQSQALPFTPPRPFNPPFLFPPLLPLTWLAFPQAAWLWLGINVGLLAWCSLIFAGFAGIRPVWARLFLFIIVITFGPVWLDLTLGQVSVFLLACTVLTGRALRHQHRGAGLPSMIAAMAKLYPGMWLVILPMLGRWRALFAALALLLLSTLSVLWLGPPQIMTEWVRYTAERVVTSNERPGVDDQSLMAWLDRMGRSQEFNVPGMSATTVEIQRWQLPWEIPPGTLRWAGYLLAGGIGLWALWRIWRKGRHDPERYFYLWVLVSLVVFPHIERYNHALLLPGMALLWGSGERGRTLAIVAYFLAGIARLTHLWVRILPAPWGPLITGSGLFAVMLLIWGLVALEREN